MDKWEIEEDLRTLRRAGEIQGSPKRMKAAKQMAAKEAKALQKVAKPAKRKK